MTKAEERYERERSFHDDRFSDDTARSAAAKYYAVDAGGSRYRRILEEIPPDARVLEYGCGTGSAAFDLAARGVDVIGIDISPVAVDAASVEATRRGLEGIRFVEMNAEALSFPADQFDAVCGSGVLHHLDLDAAYGQIARVLRPGGQAVFYEPMGTNPIINLYRRATPKMRSPDEHPLTFRDFDRARARFESVETEFFNLFALAGAVLRAVPRAKAIVPWLHRLDRWLFTHVPVSRRLAWVVVVRFARPKA
jgi:SAM-dependent methyltransferase